jgi:hypothetical protein
MAKKTLEEKIEERQQQAEQRDIFGKAMLVAKMLGSVDNSTRIQTRDTKSLTHVFNDKASSLAVRHTFEEQYISSNVDGSYTDTRRDLSITYKGNEVFRANGAVADSVYTYVPGPWEKNLDALQPAAIEKVREAQDRITHQETWKKAAAEKATRAKWGL